jgi:hypothetical protein
MRAEFVIFSSSKLMDCVSQDLKYIYPNTQAWERENIPFKIQAYNYCMQLRIDKCLLIPIKMESVVVCTCVQGEVH